VQRQAVREGIRQGLKGAELDAFVDSEIDNLQSKSWQKAMELAAAYGYSDKGSEARQKVKNWIVAGQQIPVIDIIQRFGPTLINLSAAAMRFTPIGVPLGIMRIVQNKQAGKPDFDGIPERFVDVMAGTLAGYMLSGLFEEEDEPQGDWGITNKQVRYKDSVMDYGFLWPFSIPLSAAHSAVTQWRRSIATGSDSPTTDAAMAYATGVAKAVLNSTVGTAVRDVSLLNAAMSRYEKTGDLATLEPFYEFLDKQTSTFEPRFYTEIQDAIRGERPFERRGRERIEEGVSSLRNIAYKYDGWGNKKKHAVLGNPTTTFIWELANITNIDHKPQHPGDRMIATWNMRNRKNEFRHPELSPKFTINGVTDNFTPEQYESLIQRSGKYSDENFQSMRNNKKEPLNVENPGPRDMKRLDRALLLAADKARDEIKREIQKANPAKFGTGSL